MKFQINVECSPEEAREFFGLPDIIPMQQDLMDMVSRRLSENIQTMEPEILMKTWVPALFQGWSDVQSHFWKQFTQMGGNMRQPGMNFNFNPKSSSDDENVDDDEEGSKKSSPKNRRYKR
jgi:hypothetical protein